MRAGTALEHSSISFARGRPAVGTRGVLAVVDRLAIEGRGAATWRGRAIQRRRRCDGAPPTADRHVARRRRLPRVTASPPASIWPATDSGAARDALLRAHLLLEDGVIRGGVSAAGCIRDVRGPALAEPRQAPRALGPAAFLDVAHASHARDHTDARRWMRASGLSLPGTGVLRSIRAAATAAGVIGGVATQYCRCRPNALDACRWFETIGNCATAATTCAPIADRQSSIRSSSICDLPLQCKAFNATASPTRAPRLVIPLGRE